MNEMERSELQRLKERHGRLEQELVLLGTQLRRLEDRLKTEPAPALVVRPPICSPEVVPPGLVLGDEPIASKSQAELNRQAELQPASIPPLISPQPVGVGGVPQAAVSTQPTPFPSLPSNESDRPLTFAETPGSIPPLPPRLEPELVETASAPPSRSAASFEMRLGTYWLVRVGIVMVLTGLVFFGNLAYQNYISQLGPAGKVTLLYLASGLLLGAGTWWQRKAVKESLRNYAQVLYAGGLAAVYFTTYAAHHSDHLRIINSALLDGGLLLGWAGFMVWVADRKKSQVLALFGVGLAYYTSIITRVGYFTLYSNLILTLAAVFFLVRNRWATLSFASLFATYAAYAFWRFFNGSVWQWASPEEGLWTGTYFLMSYWLVFTAAVFLSRDKQFSGQNRASFALLNNGAFFVLFLLTMLQVRQGGFWRFALCYGTVLLGLTEAARRLLAEEPLAKNSYLTQGLLLVTLGFISHPKLAGLQLALVLATESVVLLLVGQQRKNRILLTGAYLAALMAVGWGMDGMREFERHGLVLGVSLGALMLVNTLLAHRQTAAAPDTVRPGVAYFAALALIIWSVVTWNNTERINFPLVLAAEATGLTFSIYLLRVREVALLAQGCWLVAQLAWLVNTFETPGVWWRPVVMILVALGLGHWWQRQRLIVLRSEPKLIWQELYALALIGVLYLWLAPSFKPPQWLAVTSLLALGVTAYGVVTRAWLLAASAQLFLAVSVAQFILQLSDGSPGWGLTLVPLAALSLLSFAAVTWFQHKPEAEDRVRRPLLALARIYRWLALLMSLWWISKFIPERDQIPLLTLLGMLVFAWAGWRRNAEGLLFSTAFTANALGLFWWPLFDSAEVRWLDLILVLGLLGEQVAAKRLPEHYRLDKSVHAVLIVLGGVSLWWFVSRWVQTSASGFYLTASWSALALVLFACGIVLRERVYRWLGLVILAFALGRVVVFDVWKLQTLYRMLSFMALGIVLLVLGFIYNKYQEKIREWL